MKDEKLSRDAVIKKLRLSMADTAWRLAIWDAATFILRVDGIPREFRELACDRLITLAKEGRS